MLAGVHHAREDLLELPPGHCGSLHARQIDIR